MVQAPKLSNEAIQRCTGTHDRTLASSSQEYIETPPTGIQIPSLGCTHSQSVSSTEFSVTNQFVCTLSSGPVSMPLNVLSALDVTAI